MEDHEALERRDDDDDDDMYEFLGERGMEESIIKRLKEEKITKDVISHMDEELLSKYIPTVGDRVMLREFCKTRSKKTKKESLFTMLKNKMKAYDDNSSCSNAKLQKKSKKHNATKNVRKIQIGWMHDGKVLRGQSGGGTRKIEMDKESRNSDILQVGKRLFFKNGTSSQGKVEDMKFSVLDFQRVPMPDGITISDVHDLSRMDGMLRFYISTTKISPENDNGKLLSSSSTLQTFNQIESDDDYDDEVTFNPSTSTLKDFDLSETIPLRSNDDPLPSLNLPRRRRQTIQPPKDIVAEAIALAGITQSEDEHETSQNDHEDHYNENVTSSNLTISVRRGQVFKDMVNYFKGINIVENQTCEIRMLLPDGTQEAAEDNGGVFRDALSEFWETFYTTCTEGETVRVPTTIHTMQNEDWMAVAKVMVFGYKQETFFPIRIAYPFIKYCLSGDSNPKSNLTNYYLNYLPEVDKDTIETAMNNFSEVDYEELESVLSSKGVQTRLTEANLKTIICEVAHKEIIQDPAFVADCWRPVFQKHLGHLIEHKISKLYDDLNPSVRKVLSILVYPDDMTREQENTQQFLLRFIKGLNPVMLERFLRFCTGSTLIIGKKIVVSFYKEVSAFSRRPIGHTCGCVLDLPYSYKNFIDFRKEFTEILEANIWIMDII